MIRLSDHIASLGGWINIEQFMAIALYDPLDGYYSASIQNVGVRGDFSTSSTMSPLLGRALCAEWKKACRQCGKDLPVIEIGAGNASLAMSFMAAVGFWGRLKIKYHIVETSPPLRNLQHMALGRHARIHTSMEEALKSCEGEAFIISNELVDAFPARVFEYSEQGWLEVGLSIQQGKLAECLRPVEQLPPSSALECATDAGQRVEVHETYRKWFLSWLPLWKSGIMTTIDYGDVLERLYTRKPKGTLRAYQHHQVFSGMEVYEQPGKRDVTCDVNFSDLLGLLEQCPGDDISLVTQRDYLKPYANGSAEDEFLTREFGAGDHFKVLIQNRLLFKK